MKPPLWLRWLFPGVLWRQNTEEKRVFLTFDDGPVPGVTPWVIEQLNIADAKATFFCIGDNIRKYPGVFGKLRQEGFETGTHGYAHQPGHKTGRKGYFEDIDRGLEYCGKVNWFRPPHGIIFPWWVSEIRKKKLQVVLWDVLSCDYDRTLSPAEVTDNVLSNVRPGSVIVFHDSLKAWPNLKIALPAVLQWLKTNGYTTELLTTINQNKRKL